MTTQTSPDTLDGEQRRLAAAELDRLREAGEWPLTTSVPCPSWCGMRAGHGYDSILPIGLQPSGEGSVSRHHELELGSVQFEDGATVTVALEQFVTAPSDDGPETPEGPPAIGLWLLSEGRSFNAAQARALASALQAAADRLEQLD